MERLLYKGEVLELTGISYPNIWTQMRAGTFPRSVKVGAGKFGRVAWREWEIEEWIKTRPRTILKGDKKPKRKQSKQRRK